ncbi:MAG TPA: hypothetical protein VN428_00835 [Bryobacteraceae bacterium]|nr:hypothetical protein [Bryobacteraceae bacterium]
MRRKILMCAGLLALAGAGWTGYRTWPRDLHLAPSAPEYPLFEVIRGRSAAIAPADAVLFTAETLRDELMAYLHFEYLRSRREIPDGSVVLSVSEVNGSSVYEVQLVLDPDLLRAIPTMNSLRARGIASGATFRLANGSEVRNRRQQADLLVAAYNLPVRRKLESLPGSRILSPLARLLVFKAKTDRRVRERIEPVPAVLSNEDARGLAADIIAVAHFYDLPLDFFLGIGATENNYMNVMGDVDHSVWKRRAEPGDIVLARRRGRVLVRNFSIGVWQITRETLRRAHRLYLEDTRDYSELPERLRPPETLDLDGISPHVLTTYAGLFLRELLDYFDGDVEKAVGAYNGGPKNPNLKYASWVEGAAKHARRVIEQSAALNGARVAEMRFIMAGRREFR